MVPACTQSHRVSSLDACEESVAEQHEFICDDPMDASLQSGLNDSSAHSIH